MLFEGGQAGSQKEKNEEGVKEERRPTWARSGIQMSQVGYEDREGVIRKWVSRWPFFCLPGAPHFYWTNKKKVRNIIPFPPGP